MTTLNAQIIEALKLGLVFTRREAKLFQDIPAGALPMFYVTGREADDRAEGMKMAQRIEMMERVLAAVSQTIDINQPWPSDSAVSAGHWLRQRIGMLKGSGDVAATGERQRLEQIFELLATAHPTMVGEDRKALLAELETYVDQPLSFSQAALESLAKRVIKHLNGSPI